MLAQFKAMSNQQQMEQQIRQSFEQQAGRRGLTMKVVDVKKMKICGEDVEVTTYEGTDTNGFSMRQLITTFPGKDGIAMLMVMGAAQNWNTEEINKFVDLFINLIRYNPTNWRNRDELNQTAQLDTKAWRWIYSHSS